jgi:hypothetical protein
MFHEFHPIGGVAARDAGELSIYSSCPFECINEFEFYLNIITGSSQEEYAVHIPVEADLLS